MKESTVTKAWGDDLRFHGLWANHQVLTRVIWPLFSGSPPKGQAM